MYVCLCNALTDRQVKQAAATAGTTKPSSVYAACGCRAQCGQCVKALVACCAARIALCRSCWARTDPRALASALPGEEVAANQTAGQPCCATPR